MKTSPHRASIAAPLLCLCTVLLAPCFSIAQNTAFSYQGFLTDQGAPANGVYDLTFTQFNATAGGTTVGASNVINDLAVSNGLFTCSLDFGSAPFDGSDRWLQLAVRPGASTGAYTDLSPRQQITTVPYAVRAATATAFTGAIADSQLPANVAHLNSNATFTGVNALTNVGNSFVGSFAGNGAGLISLDAGQLASGTLASARLAGTYSGAVTFNNAVNSFTGDGAGLNSLNASQLTSGTVPDARLSPNVALLNANQNFTGSNNLAGVTVATNASNFFAGNFTGNGGGLTSLAAAQLTGTIAPANVGPGTINSTMLAVGSVTSNQLAADAVTTTALADGAVTTSAIADGTVTAAKVAAVSNWSAVTIAYPRPNSSGNFGIAVAALGNDLVLVGSSSDDIVTNNTGAAYLFSTNGMLLTIFTNPTPAFQDLFGASVAAVGSDRVLIGALGDDTVAPGAGAVYLFNTNGTLLTTFFSPAPANNEIFGSAVAAVGSDRVLIAGEGNIDNGGVYLFNTNGTFLTNYHRPGGLLFGSSIAAVGTNYVLIGEGVLPTDPFKHGAAYLFGIDGTLIMPLENPVFTVLGEFGSAVAALGSDRFLIGAGGQNGRAYLYDTNFTVLTIFTNPTPANFDHFGGAISSVGSDRILIGAFGDDTAASGAGAAYLFDTNGTLLASFFPPTGGGQFGFSIATTENGRLLVGAPSSDVSGVGDGAAFLFGLESYVAGLAPETLRIRSVSTVNLDDGAVTATKIGGVLFDTQIPGLDATKLVSGTLADARLSASVSRLGPSIESSEITDGTIVNADINASAAIADTKLAPISSAGKVADTALSANVSLLGPTIESGEIADGTIVNADINASAAIADTKLATISSAGKVADTALSANVSLLGPTIETGEIADGTIVNADVNASAAIADTKLATISSAGKVADTALSANVSLLGPTIETGEIADGTIVNADVNSSAAIADTKLATISSAGKVADTALSANVSLLGPTIETGEIADGTIVNADVNSSAAIADTKLATISSAGKVADTALSGNVALLGTAQTFTADKSLGSGAQLLIDHGTNGSPGLAFVGDPNTGIFEPGSNVNAVAIVTAGAERMRIEASGVGIGTTAPAATLDVAGETIVRGLFTLASSTVIPSSNSTLTPSTSYLKLNPAASITLNTTTAIADGTAIGNVLILQNIDASFTVTINDNANTQFNGNANRALGPGDTLTLIWDGNNWVELSFSGN